MGLLFIGPLFSVVDELFPVAHWQIMSHSHSKIAALTDDRCMITYMFVCPCCSDIEMESQDGKGKIGIVGR